MPIERIGRTFIAFEDQTGLRNIVRISAIQIATDADDLRDEMLLTVAGRTFVVRATLDELHDLLLANELHRSWKDVAGYRDLRCYPPKFVIRNERFCALFDHPQQMRLVIERLVRDQQIKRSAGDVSRIHRQVTWPNRDRVRAVEIIAAI